MRGEYQDALKKSHYSTNIRYIKEPKEHANKKSKAKRKRKRKIIYFQPPFCLSVKTKIGKCFINLVKKHFTPSNSLYKILNERCLKISYSCLPNVKNAITGINRNILSEEKNEAKKQCNCRQKANCPVNGKCLQDKIIYQAEISNNNGETRTYIGSSGRSFKDRWNGHKATFKSKATKGSTLATYFWKIKDAQKTEPKITWKILHKLKYSINGKNGCKICNLERYEIAKSDKRKTLNKRSELKSSCPHFRCLYF